MQELSTYGGVAGVWHAGEILAESCGGSVNRAVDEERLELFVCWIVDADAGMPFGLAASLGSDGAAAVGYGIALEFDRVAAAVPDLLFLLLLKRMVALGRQKQKPVLVADVLHVREAAAFAIGSLSLTDVNSVFFDQLYIERQRIVFRTDSPRDIEPVSMPEVGHSDLLNQSFGR